MNAFPIRFIVCMMFASVNGPFYARCIKLSKSKYIQLHFTLSEKLFCIENNVKGFRLIRFFLNEILQMSKFKFFVSRDRFSTMVAQMVQNSVSFTKCLQP